MKSRVSGSKENGRSSGDLFSLEKLAHCWGNLCKILQDWLDFREQASQVRALVGMLCNTAGHEFLVC